MCKVHQAVEAYLETRRMARQLILLAVATGRPA
jgi:hypothetical protein